MGEMILLLKFMAGCWTMERGPTTIEESWSTPKAGAMLAHGRTIRGGKMVFHEFMRIDERGGKLVYTARIGATPTEFTSTLITQNEVIFENLAHDDPKRVIYRRTESGLKASTEGRRTIEFPYMQASCESR